MEEQSGLGGRFAWIQAKPFGSWCFDHPAVIALDCEMCETQDPVSGARDSKALCRVSIVNGQDPSEILLDTLVKPSWPIIDYRTRFHGITPQDLEPVQCTLRHVQAFLMALCSHETVMVGHAVHNDLMALKMEHYCVADSSFLFPVQDSATAFASLKTLASTFLQQDMPTIHDSVLDARTALQCVLYFRDHPGKVKAVERSHSKGGGGEFAKQLLVHRIPKPCLATHLEQMFLQHTRIQPTLVPEIEFSGDTGKAIVVFLSAQHCNLAFETLQGPADTDNSGRSQKKVYLRTGSYVRVRKMAYEMKANGSNNNSASKRKHAPTTPTAGNEDSSS
jgi:RNA exonuclease 1